MRPPCVSLGIVHFHVCQHACLCVALKFCGCMLAHVLLSLSVLACMSCGCVCVCVAQRHDICVYCFRIDARTPYVAATDILHCVVACFPRPLPSQIVPRHFRGRCRPLGRSPPLPLIATCVSGLPCRDASNIIGLPKQACQQDPTFLHDQPHIEHVHRLRRFKAKSSNCAGDRFDD